MGKCMIWSANFLTSKLCKVAEQTINCKRLPSAAIEGIFLNIFMISSRWPWDKRPSTSSRTKNRTWFKLNRSVLIKSSSLPGVATMISTPWSIEASWSFIGMPPTISSSFISGLARYFLNDCICLSVCSANSLDGSIIRANGALFSRLTGPLSALLLLGERTVVSFRAWAIPTKPSFI